MRYLLPFLIIFLILAILAPLIRLFIYILPFIVLACFVYWLITVLAKLFFDSKDDEIEINTQSSQRESKNIKDVLGDVSEVKDAEFHEED